MSKGLIKKNEQFEPKDVMEIFQYAYVTEILKLVMSHKEIRSHVIHKKSSTIGILRNFRNGLSFKKNKFFEKHPQSLRIQLYFDEFVANNPLGTKVHSHKVGAFY